MRKVHPLKGVRHLAKRAAHRAGYDIVQTRLSTNASTVLERTVRLAGPIDTVIDVGASDGRWTRGMQPLLPEANYLMFEANDAWADDLRAYAATSDRFSAEYVAASDHDGEIYFSIDPNNPEGGGASATPLARHGESLPCTTIDAAVEKRGLAGPFLLKTDTQGHELQVLAGAKGVLDNAALIVMEVYGIDNPGRPTFDEICHHLRGLGFRCAGIADVMTRPRDGILWQADMHFLPSSHPSFLTRGYA
jgi:FkbM family methyltransferase